VRVKLKNLRLKTADLKGKYMRPTLELRITSAVLVSSFKMQKDGWPNKGKWQLDQGTKTMMLL
jgi:hypothetical protein